MKLTNKIDIVSIIRAFRSIFFFTLDTVIGIGGKIRRQTVSLKKRVLVLRLDAIGDFILWLDAAKEFRKLYPPETHELTLLGNTAWQDLAIDLPYFDHYRFINYRKFKINPIYRLRQLNRIRRKCFDIILQPRYSRQFICEDAIIRTSGAQIRIGFESDYANLMPWEKRVSDKWYTCLIPSNSRPMMELHRNAEFLHSLGLKSFKPDAPTLPIAKRFLLSTDLPNRYFVLIPGAGQKYRMWPKESFAALANRIFKVTEMKGLICGSSKDKSIAKDIMKMSDAKLIDLTGKTSLSELASIINYAIMVISNETSAVHMAAAANTACICITGGGHYGRFVPYDIDNLTNRKLPIPVTRLMYCFGCLWHPYALKPKGKPARCISAIHLDDVWPYIKNILTNLN